MLANWVKQATSTTGTGTITLGAASTGYVAFGDQFSDGDVVYYTIEDGNNRESGIGTYTASGTTLSRDTILETLTAGTFDNTSPTALSLSGSAVVSCSALSQHLLNNTFYTGGPPSGVSKDGMLDISTGNNYTGVTMTTDQLVLYPLVVMEGRKITKLGAKVDTADASGTNTRCGIYEVTAAGEVGTLLADSGNLDATTVGLKLNTLSSVLYLPPGRYAAAFLSEDTGVILEGRNRNNTLTRFWGTDGFSDRAATYIQNTVTGSLPASPTLTGATGNHPILFME